MRTRGREVWNSRIAKAAAWAAPAGIAAFASFSISRIGLSTLNVSLLVASGAQFLTVFVWGSIGRRIAAVEAVLLALLLLPFHFAPREVSVEQQMPFWARISLFALGIVVLIYVAGVCLSDAKRLSSER